MFECKFKYELEDSLTSAKYIYKSQRRTQDKVIAILIPILLACMVGMLIFDIIKHNSIVWDIVLLVALAALQVMYLLMPLLLVRSQKKAFITHKINELDYNLITIDNSKCVEALYKGEELVAKNEHSLKTLTSYFEDAVRLVLVFNKMEYVVLRKENITGGVTKLKTMLEKTMNKTTNRKK